MEEKELIERIVQVEQKSKSNIKRLDEHDEKLEDIHDLTYAVKELANVEDGSSYVLKNNIVTIIGKIEMPAANNSLIGGSAK
nr:MAG TPA: hypothetical protein [Caudoviricetes sp.]